MNDLVVKGRLVQLRGHMRRLWAKLTGDPRGKLLGDRDILLGKLEVYCGRMKDSGLMPATDAERRHRGES